MTAVFDTGSALLFATAFLISAYAVVTHPARNSASPAWFLTGAMALMTFVSVSNVLEHGGVSAAIDPWEDYAEIVFLPLVAYTLFRMHSESQVKRLAQEHGAVEQLGGRLAESLAELGEQRVNMLQALSAAVDAKDHYTALHSIHVADYACAIAYHLGMEDQLPAFEQAGLLHDIGKIGIPDSILLKPIGLNDDEYTTVKHHVEAAATIVGAIPFLAEVIPFVRHHHERWDGTGYPDGLLGEAIPRPARILAVADAFDAMTSDRPYRLAMNTALARVQMMEGRGTQFDPEAVDTLLELLDQGIIVIEECEATA